MPALTVQRVPIAVVALLAGLIAACMALAGLSLQRPEVLLGFWLALGAVAGFVFYTIKGDLLTAILVWFVTLIVLHEEFWRKPVPYFFALTVPRLGVLVLGALWLAMLTIGRIRLRPAGTLTLILGAVAVYFFVSAYVSGFQTRSIVSVHYRLIGGYLFPFAIFVFILHSFWHERDFRRVAVFFALLSVYLTFTGWCERFALEALIFPRFINDPNVGIHWGRVRGPFVMSAAMGLALVYCFFNNLILARNLLRGRWALYALNALMLPAIFWTKTRSVWLSFVVCAAIWACYSRRRTARVVTVSLLAAGALTLCVANMQNFLSEDREKGGVTDTEPILLRIGLAQMTWEIVSAHPLTGIGFGHFRDHAPAFARDPSSPYYAFGTTAMEHNNLLSIAAETGLVGLVLYVALILLLIRSSIRLYRKLPERSPGFISRDLIVLYWILAAAYLIDGTFRETSDNPFANCLFFGFSAIPVALDYLLGPKPIRARPGFPPQGRPAFRPGEPRPASAVHGLRPLAAGRP